ncbi:MAG: hypothetical protein JHC93_02555 [Parachlamydiales bacterium]|nr:hypothetical protein [Parachlamydiales bacterium]
MTITELNANISILNDAHHNKGTVYINRNNKLCYTRYSLIGRIYTYLTDRDGKKLKNFIENLINSVAEDFQNNKMNPSLISSQAVTYALTNRGIKLKGATHLNFTFLEGQQACFLNLKDFKQNKILK